MKKSDTHTPIIPPPNLRIWQFPVPLILPEENQKSATGNWSQKSQFIIWRLPKCFTYLLSCYCRTAKRHKMPRHKRKKKRRNFSESKSKCMPCLQGCRSLQPISCSCHIGLHCLQHMKALHKHDCVTFWEGGHCGHALTPKISVEVCAHKSVTLYSHVLG